MEIGMTDKVQKIREEVARIQLHTQSEVLKQILDFIDSLQEEPVSEDLEKAANEWDAKASFTPFYMTLDDKGNPNGVTQDYTTHAESFKAGAKWQKANLWKPADGDDLPEIDREVIALVKYSTQRNIHDEEYPTYRVGFGHRPNPNGWDGKNIDTDEVTHYTPKLYDKGGWNAPNIVYWLDVRLPKEIEL